MDQDIVVNSEAQSDSGDNTPDPEPPTTRSKKGKRATKPTKKTPSRKAKAETAAASPKDDEPEESSPKVDDKPESPEKVEEKPESPETVEETKEAPTVSEEKVKTSAEVEESSVKKSSEVNEQEEESKVSETVVMEEEIPAEVHEEEEIVMEEVHETEVVASEEVEEEPMETEEVVTEEKPVEEEAKKEEPVEEEAKKEEPVEEEAKKEEEPVEQETKKEEPVEAKKAKPVEEGAKNEEPVKQEVKKKVEKAAAKEPKKKEEKPIKEAAKVVAEKPVEEKEKPDQEEKVVKAKTKQKEAVETAKKEEKVENAKKKQPKETEDNSKKKEDLPEVSKRKRDDGDQSPGSDKAKVADETSKKKLKEAEVVESPKKKVKKAEVTSDAENKSKKDEVPSAVENKPKKTEVTSDAEADAKTKKAATLVDVPETEPVSEDGGDSTSGSEAALGDMVTVDEVTGDDEVKEPETEAVSDEEFPVAAVDLPETEAVSEDELPPEKNEKKKESPVKSASSDSSTRKKRTKSQIKSEGQKRKLVDGDTYDPGSPTSENSDDETPSKRTATTGKVKSVVVVKKALSELDKYWKAVKEDPTDFTGWTYLLQYVDQENDIEAAREAYDAFLSHYPYCYGYWRKYADYEKRKGNKDKCENVFERGLKAIPLSVDLWIHYLNYMKATYPDDEHRIRNQFEKGIEACGMEFRSDRLWDSYIKWEAENKKLQNVTNLYDRLLAIPTQGYTNHFEAFQEHISNNIPQKVLSVDEFLTLRREVLQMLKQYEQPLAMEDKVPGEEDEVPPGEESEEQPAVKSDEETTALRERIISLRRKVHKNTVTMVAERWNYEEAIKRPYFHVKPLERSQLKNWKEYLDFEIERGDQERIIVLFERCLIACALYEEFWIKFIRYLESLKEDMTDKIRNVYERACLIHHTKKPNLHLHWAAFEESNKNYQKASEILSKLEESFPNMLQIAYRRINLERRWGDHDKVCSLYEHYINISKNKVIANNMAIKYARFCWKIKGDVEKAISVLNKAVEKDKENPRLYLQLIDMGLQKSPVDENEIVGIIDQFLAGDSELEQKVLFAQRKVEFLEDFGTDVLNVQRAHEEFQKFFKMAKDRKKRSPEFDKMNAESAGKKQKSGSSSGGDAAQNHMSSHASSQSPHGGGSSQQAPQPSATAATGPYPPPAYAQNGGYSQQAPPTAAGGYQGSQYPATGGAAQPPAPYNQQQYNQQYSQSSDPNYANYQGWGYSQTGYGGYNQGWGNYNYY